MDGRYIINGVGQPNPDQEPLVPPVMNFDPDQPRDDDGKWGGGGGGGDDPLSAEVKDRHRTLVSSVLASRRDVARASGGRVKTTQKSAIRALLIHAGAGMTPKDKAWAKDLLTKYGGDEFAKLPAK